MISIAMGIRRIRQPVSKHHMAERRHQDQAHMQIPMRRLVLLVPMAQMASADSARHSSVVQLVRF
jgi:hypothetical protein